MGNFNDIPLIVTASSTAEGIVDEYWNQTEKRQERIICLLLEMYLVLNGIM